MDGINPSVRRMLNFRRPDIGILLKLREDQRPRPLDQARRRQPLSETPAHDQSQSLLFKLPIEIRQAIYAEAGLASYTTIHCFTHAIKKHGASRSAGRIVGKLCTLPPSLEIPYTNPAAYPHCPACRIKAQQTLKCRPESFTNYDLEGTSPSITPLLQTCRRIYTEATPTLYTTNTFSFTCTWTLTDFLACTLPTTHTSRIRHLSLTWTLYPFYPPHLRPGLHDHPYSVASWRALWARVGADMPGLRRLRLELCDSIRGRCRVDPRFEESRIWRMEPLGLLYAEAPQRFWLEWLEPVGKALEGREEEVEVEGGIWCKFGEEGSVHGVIKGGRGGGRRVLVLADGEEVEW